MAIQTGVQRQAEVTWEGNLTEGKGTIVKVGSGAIGELPITWAARVERSDGKTSPEELLAAAHAACYAMAFSNTLNKAGNPPERLDVTAVCTLDTVDGKRKITNMDLTVKGRVPNLDAAGFQRIAEEAEAGCPVSNALRNNLKIQVNATLE